MNGPENNDAFSNPNSQIPQPPVDDPNKGAPYPNVDNVKPNAESATPYIRQIKPDGPDDQVPDENSIEGDPTASADIRRNSPTIAEVRAKLR